MSKAETIDALMESAIQSFSRLGYEGASLRDIARNAGVPLSTIHLYFGSKNELFDAVRQRAWDDINDERTALLEQALAAHEPGDALLSGIIYALGYPVVHRALSNDPRDLAYVFLMRAHWNRMPDAEALEIADRSLVRWFDAVRACCPAFSRSDAAWALSYSVGAIYSWQLLDHRYDGLIGGPAADRNSGDIAADVVEFCRAGIRALSDLRERSKS
ncbi:MAG: TetR/AcrR family transcriptional regulator [Hyphomonadaceae bacterium]